MIRELSDLGKSLRTKSIKDKFIHDALKDEPISIDLIIKEDGSFERFDVIEKIIRPAEALTSKKGKARLLLDKAEEVLGYHEEQKKHTLFLKKMEEYRELSELKAVFAFYEKNSSEGLDKALSLFEEQVREKERKGNIAFRIKGKDIRIHQETRIYKAIIGKYKIWEEDELKKSKNNCSICGKPDHPVIDIPHGMIKHVPDGQSSGCALVSYNEKAFESYNLIGNNNSSICTHCALTYVEGLNWLMSNGSSQIVQDANGKDKEVFKYTNRRKFGSDTAMVFWTRSHTPVAEIDMLEEPQAGDVAKLIDSVSAGKTKSHIKTDQFYSCTLSGAAARIAVRDWIEQSLYDLQQSIAAWFKDIAIERYNFDLKRNEIYYSRLYDLARCSRNEKEKNDPTLSRVAVYLWNVALKNNFPPMWILASVLKRIRVDDKGVTPERAALIRLILNRSNKKGGFMLKEKIDMENTSTAYICGRIFSVLEGIQRAALGKDLNAGIRDRFFSSASTNPSSAFGRLMKMSQNHLSKVKGEKPGLAVIFNKELAELFSKVNGFPVVFNLEEQGQFAIGYYHQKHDTFKRAAENKELKAALEINDENNEKGE
ncbi:MAG: type I-C CRISPR-associated protein Cas8c/Csd1 [Spirochaetes bacterium RBG_16_49_21]|nr:MAG: type I-C CRISPR-associated protein Cas8c/Csd1 [Spirochaetes bacterium RBG_16_49_21]